MNEHLIDMDAFLELQAEKLHLEDTVKYQHEELERVKQEKSALQIAYNAILRELRNLRATDVPMLGTERCKPQ